MAVRGQLTVRSEPSRTFQQGLFASLLIKQTATCPPIMQFTHPLIMQCPNQHPSSCRSGANLRTIKADKHRTIDNASLQRFLLDGFRSYFTILSDCFSIFRHRTCSLSVSGRYFNQVLDGVYHPLQAVIPDSPTRRRRSENVHAHATGYTQDFHLLGCAFSDNFCLRCAIGRERSTHPTTRCLRCRGID